MRFTDIQIAELSPQDFAVLKTARGWFGLKLYDEVATELAKASPGAFQHPDFLEIRSLLHAVKFEWMKSLILAYQLTETAPRSPYGFCLRADAIRNIRFGGPAAAYESLVEVVGRFPGCALIKFNLAGFACEKGSLFTARRFLAKAFKLAAKSGELTFYRNLALTKSEFQPLWAEIPRIIEIAQRAYKK